MFALLGVEAGMFDITIKADHLNVGIKGNQDRYLNVESNPSIPPPNAPSIDIHIYIPSFQGHKANTVPQQRLE